MEKKINTKFTVKIVLDIIMLVLLLTFYQKMAISMSFHEIAGLVIGALFIIHNILNWGWIKSVTSKLFSKTTSAGLRASWIVDLLLFISMMAIVITGIMINKTLPIKFGSSFGAKSWHYFFAALSVILMGVHIGLHWKLVKGLLAKKVNFSNKVVKSIGIAILAAVLVFGGYNLATGSVLGWISGPFISSQAPEGFGKDGQGFGNGMQGFGDGNQEFDMSKIPDMEGSDFDASKVPDMSSQEFDPNNKPDMSGQDFDFSKKPEGFDGMPQNVNRQGQSFSILRLLSVMAKYGSQMILFAVLTVLCTMIPKRKQSN